MKDLRQECSPHRLHHGVNVVRHHNEMAEHISLAIKMPQGPSRRWRKLRVFAAALAHARIQPVMKTVGEFFVKLRALFRRVRFRIFFQPLFLFMHPLPQLLLRNRIGKPERDEVSRPVLPPMRQMPAVNRHWRGRIERRERQGRFPACPAGAAGAAASVFFLLALARSPGRRDARPTLVASVALVMMMLVSLSNKRRRKNSATSIGAALSVRFLCALPLRSTQ